MTITVEINPELEAELSRQAEVRGVDVASYAARLIEGAVQPITTPRKVSTPEEFERTLEDLAKYSDKIPALPDEAFTRESIYRDHD